MTRIAAVIVTYNNSGMLEALLRALEAQSRRPDLSIVVDNAGDAGTSSVAARFPGVVYVRLPRNTGSAGGYAEGLRLALERGCGLIWTLDDDVSPEPDALAWAVGTLKGFPEEERVCAVRAVGAGHPVPYPTRLPVIPWRGTLLTAEAVGRAGPPERNFFLYGEDLEYSLRLTRLGYRFYWAPASRCIESRMDGKTELRFFGLRARVYSDPSRLYYAFRNEIYIYLLYRRPADILRVLAYALKLSAAFVLLRPAASVEKIMAISGGIRDGFSGRLGERPGTGRAMRFKKTGSAGER
ncbi:MAG: glycosyltransferase [Elusimicrobiales bacterium]|jgi:GT2 family glycosyltransferase